MTVDAITWGMLWPMLSRSEDPARVEFYRSQFFSFTSYNTVRLALAVVLRRPTMQPCALWQASRREACVVGCLCTHRSQSARQRARALLRLDSGSFHRQLQGLLPHQSRVQHGANVVLLMVELLLNAMPFEPYLLGWMGLYSSAFALWAFSYYKATNRWMYPVSHASFAGVPVCLSSVLCPGCCCCCCCCCCLCGVCFRMRCLAQSTTARHM